MSSVIAAVVTVIGAVVVAFVGSFFSRVRRDLEACERDRKQLKQVLQLVVGSIVGLLPQQQKLELLAAVDEALNDEGA